MTMTSLFKKFASDRENKFTIILPMGGIIYSFLSDDDGMHKVVMSTKAK